MYGDFKNSAGGTNRSPTIDDTTGGVIVKLASAAASPAVVQLSDGSSTYQAGTQTTLAAVLAALSPGTPVASTSLEKSHRISSGPCTLLQIVATNTDVADAWLLLFDSASGTVPANATVARESYPVPAGGTGGVQFFQGSSFTAGCWAALSSTVGTLTLVTGSTALFKAEIRT